MSMQTRKKIVFVLPTLMAGGAERVLITLMNGLDRAQFAPELLVVDDRGTLRDWVAADTPLHTLNQPKIRFGLPKLAGMLNELQPDIIVSTMAAMNFAVLMVRPFLKRPPYLIVREAVIPSSISEAQSAPWLVRAAYRTLYPRADMVLSPAQCIIDEFKDYLGMDTQHHVLLHNPVDVERIRSGALPARKNESRVEFICAGRLHMQKGFDRLIKALPLMAHSHDWHLTIMGEGEEQENLQAFINAHNLQARITLTGLVKDPWPHIAGADCFLLPSRWEGLPNVVLESLCAGTPVIALREAGGIEEIARLAPRGAVTVTAGMDQFMEALTHVKPAPANTYRASLLPEHFNLENVVERFANILNDPPASARKAA